MNNLELFLLFAFGSVVGSFLNVVSLRYNTGRSVHGRSGCASCGAQLRWYELIPIISFLYQRGRCRTCRSAISWQYPLVEILTGLLFIFLFRLYRDDLRLFFLYAIEWSLLIIILVYDMRHKIIPDRFVYSFSAITLLSVFLSPESIIAIPEGVWQALFAGPMLAMPFALLWLISGGKWVGLGDAKLSLGLGWMLGVTKSISVFLLSFWIGAIISVAIVLFERYCTPHSSLSRTHGRLTMKGEVPFAPFLILGTGLVFLFGADIVALFLW